MRRNKQKAHLTGCVCDLIKSFHMRRNSLENPGFSFAPDSVIEILRTICGYNGCIFFRHLLDDSLIVAIR